LAVEAFKPLPKGIILKPLTDALALDEGHGVGAFPRGGGQVLGPLVPSFSSQGDDESPRLDNGRLSRPAYHFVEFNAE